MAKKKEQQQTEDENFNFIVRIVNTDIDGQKRTVVGLQSIKGVGKRVAQIVATKANVDPAVKMGSLSDEKVKEPPSGPSTGRTTTSPVPTCTCSGTTWTSSRRMTSTG